jgi:hypothetical protein
VDLVVLLVVLTGVVTTVWTLASKPWRRPSKWERVARELGLDWHAKYQTASGWIDGHFLKISREPLHITRVDAAIWPPLDLGLVAPSIPMGVVYRNEDHPDRAISASSDPERTAKLFDYETRAILGHARPVSGQLQLLDDHLSVSLWEVATPDELRALLTGVLRILRVVDRARKRVPPARELVGVARAWSELANLRRFSGRSCPLGFSGEEAGMKLEFFTRRRPGGWVFAAVAEFRVPLEIGFRAATREFPTDMPFGQARLLTHDKEFNAAFVVSAFEAHYIQEALSLRARARLVELARTWRYVLVDDYGVSIEVSIDRYQEVSHVLEEARSAAELVDFVHPKRAYR